MNTQEKLAATVAEMIPAYDRELIAQFLESVLRGKQHRFQFTTISEQVRLLREAANAEAAGVETVAASEDGLPELAKGLDEAARRMRGEPFGNYTEWAARAAECEHAANLIRRLATPEQPGSAVRGDGWHGPGHSRLGDPCPVCPQYLNPPPKLIARPIPEQPGLSRLHCDKCGAGSYGLHTDTTPPPAPAAEQGNALAEQFRKGWEAGRADALAQPEARGAEGMRNALEEIATVAHSDQSESDLETVLAWLASIVDPLLAATPTQEKGQ